MDDKLFLLTMSLVVIITLWVAIRALIKENIMEHTKGKWEAVNTSGALLGVRNKDGFICFLSFPTRYPTQAERYEKELAEMKANARLIAAAPELLAACEWTARGEHHSACIHHKNYLKCGCYVEAAKQAIKAAK